MSDQASWYAVHTQPRAEKRVERGLLEHRFETYFPQETVWRRLARRKVADQRPLFVGYLFVGLVGEPRFDLVRSIDGVRGFVGVRGKPRAVGFDRVDDLRQAETLGLFDRTRKGPLKIYKPGEAVRIVGGPFTGFMAKIMGAASSDDRIRILINDIMAGEIGVADLRPAASS